MEALHRYYKGLYGTGFSQEDQDRRYERLCKAYEESFGKRPEFMLSSSGRTEIAGNHTDHNNGLVIGAAINCDTIAAAGKREDMIVNLYSEGFTPVSIDLSCLDRRDEENSHSASLVRGIARAMKDRGYSIGGFDACTSSRVLRGSGLSSSAAIEVLIAKAFNTLFNDDRASDVELALVSQWAENNYYGKPSGLLDQLIVANGSLVKADFLDPSSPAIEKLDVDFASYGLDLVITDSKQDHADLTDDYASIPREMKDAASFFGCSTMRGVCKDEFIASIPELRRKLGNDRAVLRAYHFISENERVVKMEKALKEKRIDDYLALVRESGNSSFRFLQNLYPSSRPTEQALSVAIALSEDYLGGRGAVRVHGGGFAGTIQAYVPREMTKGYMERMDGAFGEGSSMVLSIRHEPVFSLRI